MNEAERRVFEKVVNEARELQQRFVSLASVVVGGTAAAIHARHRVSLDSDHVTQALSENFEEVMEELSQWEGWQTLRTNRPILILGERHGIQLGLRQQRRAVPLETEAREGLIIPTSEEMLRIKAYLLTRRRATRDYLDVAALADVLGRDRVIEGLQWLNVLYEGEGNQTAITKFADAVRQAPRDFEEVELFSYRGLIPRYTDWHYVQRRCQETGDTLFLREMEGDLPSDVKEFERRKVDINKRAGGGETGDRREERDE